MYYYLYQIRNVVNNKIYVGVHKTSNLQDGYMGSGKVIKRAIKKYGVENFEKIILYFFDSYDDALTKEKEIVTDEFLLREDVYNLRRGGSGGFDFINKQGLSVRNITKENAKVLNKKGRETQRRRFLEDEDFRNRKRANGKRLRAEPGSGFAGKTHSTETREKLSELKRGKGKGEKNSQFGTCWMYNSTINENKKIKVTEIEEYLLMGWIKGRKIKNK